MKGCVTMADIRQIIENLRTPPDEGNPESIYDDLLAEYTGQSEGWAAGMNEKASAIEALNAEISRLKAANYDLLMQVQADASEPDDTPDVPDDNIEGIDSLFGKEGD